MGFESHREVLQDIITAVRRKCDPADLVARAVGASGYREAAVVGAAVGKAAPGMIQGLYAGIGGSFWGTIAVPSDVAPPESSGLVSVYVAGHPLPDELSLAAGRSLTASAWRQSLELFGGSTFWLLLSGGASSLAVDPPAQISLADYRSIALALLRAGANIGELNTVRKHIDGVKGGWLARRLAPTRVRLLVLSDVLGDDLSVIGSGPVYPDPTTYADALDVLDEYGCLTASSAVTEFLKAGARGEIPETPKPGDPDLARVQSILVGNNDLAIDAAVAELGERNVPIWRRRRAIQGEASVVGAELGQQARAMAAKVHRGAIAWGGETTVAVGSATGKGGRNQELALAAAIEIDGTSNLVIATFATDGVDGPTDAAGAIVTGRTCNDARRLGLDPRAALANHDSYSFFEALGKGGFPHLIKTGPTGTNVNDLAIALAY